MSKAKNIAIIPARGGSKRIPRKNIKDFLGKPIIAYSIEAALKSELFDEVMVSTDDYEIAEVAKKYGASVPFMRSKENSDDFATTSDVILEVLEEYKRIVDDFDYFCCIYPTAPFITPHVLIESFNLMIKVKADSVIPVVKFNYPIQRALKINNNNKLEYIWPENINKRSQDFDHLYHDAGQFYWSNVDYFYKNERLISQNSVPFVLAQTVVQDIDNKEDWKLAEIKYLGKIEE